VWPIAVFLFSVFGIVYATRGPAVVPVGPQPAAAAAVIVTPWQSIADLPRGAWYRGIGPAHLRDVTAWRQVEAVDPPWVKIGGEWFTPDEMLTRFEWTDDPFPESLVRNKCGR
jgi:hypothetical protein